MIKCYSIQSLIVSEYSLKDTNIGLEYLVQLISYSIVVLLGLQWPHLNLPTKLYMTKNVIQFKV
jgi:hypothetical protein